MGWLSVKSCLLTTIHLAPRCLSRGLRREAFISRSLEEHSQRLKERPAQPEHSKILDVSIIGVPNAGKSTLMNSVIGMSVSAASPKPHTTRKNVIGVYTDDTTQIVFHDSPGLVTADHCMKHHLESNHRSDPLRSTESADVILVIVDASNIRDRTKLNPGIIDILEKKKDKTSILVLNKVDILGKKLDLLDITNHLTGGIVDGVPIHPEGLSFKTDESEDELDRVMDRMTKKGYIIAGGSEAKRTRRSLCWNEFARVFMTSAKTGDGVEKLIEYLVSQAKLGDWKYNCDLPSPRSPLVIVEDILREHILTNLDREAPYLISCVIQSWTHDPRSGSLAIYVDFVAPNDNYASALLGSKGSRIHKISADAKNDISNVFECDVKLKIAVKSKRSNYN